MANTDVINIRVYDVVTGMLITTADSGTTDGNTLACRLGLGHHNVHLGVVYTISFDVEMEPFNMELAFPATCTYVPMSSLNPFEFTLPRGNGDGGGND